ncbi:MAG: hypothetical protein R3C56_07300 [Pirellulaceae bacterium]
MTVSHSGCGSDIDFLEMWRGEREQLDALAERLREDEPTLEWLKDCIVPERRAGMIASLLVRAGPTGNCR